jgi:hypothetical protein
VRRLVEQADVLVLGRDVEEPPQARLEHPDRAERAVDERPPPPRAARGPADEQLAGPGRGREAGGGHALEDGVPRRQLEEGLHHDLVGAVPEHVGSHPATQHEMERIHQDRLPRAGLAGDDVESGAEFHLDPIHDREAGDTERREHARSMTRTSDTAQIFSGDGGSGPAARPPAVPSRR